MQWVEYQPVKYPWTERLIHDQGTEFMGEAFQALLRQWEIWNAPILGLRNPQVNALCKRMHQVVGNIHRTLLHTNPTQDLLNVTATIDYALQVATYAIKTTLHRKIGIVPGALVFQRDMIMDLPFMADLLTLRNKRQELLDYKV